MTPTIDISIEDLERSILLLDAALDALDAAAAREKRREQGKAMKEITEQKRAEVTRVHVTKMKEKYGLEID